MSSFRLFLFLSLFFLFAFNTCYSQNDSDKIRVGPDELQSQKGGNYHNFADKNKINIEIVVLGLGAGKYLIPQGTNLFDFLIMVGGTTEYVLEDIKIVRFKSDTPKLQATQVMEFHMDDLYGNESDILRPIKNPLLKPGDMLILPVRDPGDQSLFFYIQQTIYFVGTLISFYYLIDNVYGRFR